MRLRPATFAVAAGVFLTLDAVWLTAMGTRLYRPAIGHLMRLDVDWIAAALFYVVYIGGLAAFAIAPSANARQAAWRGAGFGLAAYATYDLTCQATMRDWPWSLTIVDLAWGTIASAAACAAAAAVTLRR